MRINEGEEGRLEQNPVHMILGKGVLEFSFVSQSIEELVSSSCNPGLQEL